MIRVILDHYARWGLLWCILMLFFAGYSLLLWQLGIDVFIPFGLMAAGSICILNDSTRGALRSMTVLPMTAKQLARGFWWVAVGLPTILTINMAGISWWLASTRGETLVVSGPSVLMLFVIPLLTIVSAFLGVCIAPRKAQDSGSEVVIHQIFNSLAVVLAQLSIFAPILIGDWLMKEVGWSVSLPVSLLAVILLVATWFQAERLVKAPCRQLSQRGAKSRRVQETTIPQSGPSGWKLLIQKEAWNAFSISFIGSVGIAAVVAALTTFIALSNTGGIPEAFSILVEKPRIVTIIASLSMMAALLGYSQLIPQLRILRVLPIKRHTITALLIGPALMGIVVFLLVLIAMVSMFWAIMGASLPPETVIIFLQRGFLAGSLALLVCPVFLRWGSKGGTQIMLMVTLMVVLGQSPKIVLPEEVVWVVSAVSILLASWLVNRVLKTSAPWRLPITEKS